MKKFKKNEKGMTLIEMIVAIAIFGMTCATLFTAMLFAINSNKLSIYTGREMQQQQNVVEEYNHLDSLGANGVIKNNLGGLSGNKITLDAVFDDGTKVSNENVYAFQAKLNNIDVDAGYSLRFFEPESNEVRPDPDKGFYWVKIWNYSSANIDDLQVTWDPAVTLINSGGTNHQERIWEIILPNGCAAFGMLIKNTPDTVEELWAYQEQYTNMFTNMYGDELSDGTLPTFILTRSNMLDYCELDPVTNKPTGYINVYYYKGNYYNFDGYEAARAAG